MSRLGKSIRWYVSVTLLLIIVVGGGGIWFWMRSDEILKSQLSAKLEELVPNWKVEIGRTKFDWKRQIHVYDVQIQGDQAGQPLMRLPEVVVLIDLERFKTDQQIVAQKVILKHPRLNLVRSLEGAWNWQNMGPPPKSESSIPEVEIRNANFRIEMENGLNRAPAEVLVEEANFKLVPSGKRNLSVQGLTQINDVGRLSISGNVGVDSGVWDLKGAIAEVKTQGEFLSLIAGQSPELLGKLQQLNQKMKDFPNSKVGANYIKQASSSSVVASDASSNEIPDFGIGVTFDLGFQVSKQAGAAEPQFQFQFNLKDGLITNDILPFPLSDITGSVIWDNHAVTIDQLKALNGPVGLMTSGTVNRTSQLASCQFDIHLRNVSLEDSIRDRLTPSLRKLYNDFNPTGIIDLDIEVEYEPGSKWKYKNLAGAIREGTCRFIKFPYPLSEINGSIRQRPDSDLLDVDIKGVASRREVNITGTIKNPGPLAESRFDLAVKNLPIDETLLAASTPQLRKTLEALQIQGQVDARVQLYRPPGHKQKFQQIVDADVHHAAIQYLHFPYPINELTGRIEYDNRERIWRFKNLEGRNGLTELTAKGVFNAQQVPGELSLTIDAENGLFDSPLKQALNPKLQTLWDDISPNGKLDLTAIINWTKGTAPVITLPRFKIRAAEMTMRWFPYPIKNIEADLEYSSRQSDLASGQPHPTLAIKSFRGSHDDTTLSTKGNIDWIDYQNESDWRIQLQKLHVDDLIPDRMFRIALPPDLSKVVLELNPQGNPVSIAGELELRGSSNPQLPVTAGWNIETVFSGSDLWGGVDLEHVRGSVTSRGLFDGQHIEMTGNIDLESAELWGDYQLTDIKGPYFLVDRRLWVGTIPRPTRPVSFKIEREKITPVTAKAIGGSITLTGNAVVNTPTNYQFRLMMENGLLEEYARLYLPGTHDKIKGVINCWVELQGQGNSPDQLSGRGQLMLKPAALYELPVFVQMFNEIGGLLPQNKAAFNSAFTEFEISQRQFRFKMIDLDGDSIKMRGQGWARFDGQLNLDFFSMLPRNSVPIPFVNSLVGAASLGWVGIEVRGKTNAPVIDYKAVPALDNAIQNLFRTLPVRGSNNSAPKLAPPFIFPQQQGRTGNR